MAEEIVYADQQRVVIAIRDGGRIRDSRAEITSRYFHAWRFRDGKVVRLSSHLERAAALKAVGLAEGPLDDDPEEKAGNANQARPHG